MAQFDVFHNANPDTKDEIPYLLDIQADILESIATRVIVPISSLEKIPKPISIVNPVFNIDGQEMVALFDELSAYPKNALGDKISSLIDERAKIMQAYDFLFQGY